MYHSYILRAVSPSIFLNEVQNTPFQLVAIVIFFTTLTFCKTLFKLTVIVMFNISFKTIWHMTNKQARVVQILVA